MKKFIAAAIIALGLVGCGNRDIPDANYIYGYVLAKWPDGTMKKIDVKRWYYYKDGQVKIIAHDGTLYMFAMDNVVLVLEAGR